ncbi:phosphate-starvation-inducible protein PsiE [Arsenophonus nasoniae]|uniref:Protein PsiE n=1 Tax=Arsenophonus nasoniae TaxID=638 RepID=A0A4P7KXE9_9GAMM|nr:phosphate-starvation-inducible protein PsiE [Arsenophonus nasoniae]QBY45027.1 Protein PsiE [Arsenophonus nasoniae]WGM05249.1 phosphate-starvation-inducible protein PsiE [Arsenophonus nasoniae]WGM10260.1 phosphate-starvation-inducible protein PsiE [Arsenophonus nasoniae]WGM14975.1 phosphate-starvation-inducible protein PsiE [Arsenophonus nasoniae]
MSGLSQSKLIARLLQWIISCSLLIIAIILIIFLIKETIVLSALLFKNSETMPSYLLLEGIITYFLYFEFIALIIKYFQSVYHFPLQYFIYIGITAIIRLIIVEHKEPISVLVYSVSILVMILALYIANTKRLIK